MKFFFCWSLVIFTFLGYYYSEYYFRIPIILFGIYLLINSRDYIFNKAVFNLVIIAIPFSIINFIDTDGKSLFLLLILVSHLYISGFIFFNSPAKIVIIQSYYIFLSLTLILVFLFDYGPEEFNSFFLGVSRNGYSAFLFSLYMAYCLIKYSEKKEISLTLSALTFFLMIPLYGRSSIVATGIVVAAVFLKKLRFCHAIGLLAIFTLLSFFKDYMIWDVNVPIANFASGVESERFDILAEWSNKLSIQTALMGVNLKELQTVVLLNGDAHNGFLRLHSFWGIGVLPIFFYIFKSFFLLVIEKKYLIVTLLISILFKISLDTILFVSDLDYFLMPIIFYSIFFVPKILTAQRHQQFTPKDGCGTTS